MKSLSSVILSFPLGYTVIVVYKLVEESTKAELPIFMQTCNWLDIYFSGKEPGFTPPISLHTTPFRKAVYDILLTIPYGQTMTYGEIALILAEKQGMERMSAQAVGSAVGHNPISIIIPCHRVVGADGSLTGYAGGLDKKTALLKLAHYPKRYCFYYGKLHTVSELLLTRQ